MVLMDVLIAQETQMGIELVECAISLNALVVFGHTFAAKERGHALVAGLGINFHDVLFLVLFLP